MWMRWLRYEGPLKLNVGKHSSLEHLFTDAITLLCLMNRSRMQRGAGEDLDEAGYTSSRPPQISINHDSGLISLLAQAPSLNVSGMKPGQRQFLSHSNASTNEILIQLIDRQHLRNNFQQWQLLVKTTFIGSQIAVLAFTGQGCTIVVMLRWSINSSFLKTRQMRCVKRQSLYAKN